MAGEPDPQVTRQLAEALVGLFHAHGVGADVVPGQAFVGFLKYPGRWAEAELFDRDGHARLDVRLDFAAGRAVVESFVGAGATTEERARDALARFSDNTFHVLLSAFFGQPLCHGTEREEWEIGGRRREVYFGGVLSRYELPLAPGGGPDLRFFEAFGEAVKAQPLAPGTHWIRVYHLRRGGEMLANEVLLDNEPWAEVEAAMAAFPWPVAGHLYDLRQFLVVKDAGRWARLRRLLNRNLG